MQVIPLRSDASSVRDERRRYLRYAVRCACWLESDESSVFAATVDVGLGGLFLRTAIPMPKGQRVRVALSLGRKGQAMLADGLVTRAVRARQGQRHGVGVEFLDIRDGREGFKRFLNAR
jgi:hypothetical protein